MFAVHLTLRPAHSPDLPAAPSADGAAAPGECGAAAVQEALWGCAGPEDGLEHIRARSGPSGLGLVLFVRAPDHAEAERRARDLLDRALAGGAVGPFALVPP